MKPNLIFGLFLLTVALLLIAGCSQQAQQPAPPATTPAPVPTMVAATPVPVVQTTAPVIFHDDLTETDYYQLNYTSQRFSNGTPDSFTYTVTTQPLYVRINLTPTYISQPRIVNPGLSDEKTVIDTIPDPRSWYELDVIDPASGMVLQKSGFQKAFGTDTQQKFRLGSAGTYQIVQSGNMMAADVQILSGIPEMAYATPTVPPLAPTMVPTTVPHVFLPTTIKDTPLLFSISAPGGFHGQTVLVPSPGYAIAYKTIIYNSSITNADTSLQENSPDYRQIDDAITIFMYSASSSTDQDLKNFIRGTGVSATVTYPTFNNLQFTRFESATDPFTGTPGKTVVYVADRGSANLNGFLPEIVFTVTGTGSLDEATLDAMVQSFAFHESTMMNAVNGEETSRPAKFQ